MPDSGIGSRGFRNRYLPTDLSSPSSSMVGGDGRLTTKPQQANRQSQAKQNRELMKSTTPHTAAISRGTNCITSRTLKCNPDDKNSAAKNIRQAIIQQRIQTRIDDFGGVKRSNGFYPTAGSLIPAGNSPVFFSQVFIHRHCFQYTRRPVRMLQRQRR